MTSSTLCRTIIAVICLLVALLLSLLWACFRPQFAMRAAPAGGAENGPQLVGFSMVCTTNNGRCRFTGWLTNNAGVPIRLPGTVMESVDDRGQTQHQRGWDLFNRWSGLTNYDTLPVNGVGTLSFDTPASARRVRLLFEYVYDANGVKKALSAGLGKLSVSRLSQENLYRLNVNGLLDGVCKRSYDGEWVANPAFNESGQRADFR